MSKFTSLPRADLVLKSGGKGRPQNNNDNNNINTEISFVFIKSQGKDWIFVCICKEPGAAPYNVRTKSPLIVGVAQET